MPELNLSELPFPITLGSVSLEMALILARGAVLSGALLLLGWAFARWRRAQARAAQRVFEQLDLIQGELNAVSMQLETLTGQVQSLQERAAAEPRSLPALSAGSGRGYDAAIRLAQRGATAAEIAGNCGLTRHEAGLLVRLHGLRESVGQVVDPAPQAVVPLRGRLTVVG